MIKKYNKLWLKIQYLIVLFEKKCLLEVGPLNNEFGKVWTRLKKKRRFFLKFLFKNEDFLKI